MLLALLLEQVSMVVALLLLLFSYLLLLLCLEMCLPLLLLLLLLAHHFCQLPLQLFHARLMLPALLLQRLDLPLQQRAVVCLQGGCSLHGSGKVSLPCLLAWQG